jgi:hypothetical protein
MDSSGTFVGTVADSDPGTVFYSTTITGVRPDFVEGVELEDGTGGLANVEGEITRVSVAGMSAVYSGTVEFDDDSDDDSDG